MQLALAVLSLVAVASAFSEVNVGYHRSVGIPLATKIKAAEDARARRYGRIAGGEEAEPTAHPYLVGLVITLENTALPSVCGGTIVSRKSVVTAGRCMNDGEREAIRTVVVANSARLFSGGHRVAATSVTIHPEWDPATLQNDVAIISVNNPFTLSDGIQIIALPDNFLNENFVGEQATTVGYGKTSDDQTGVSVHAVVNQVDVDIISTEACQAVYGTWAQDTNICTDGSNGVGICGGDIGGPLLVVRDEKPVLVGVASFFASTGCQSGHPSAFSRVTSFYEFISENI